MIKMTETNGNIQYDVNSYVCDTEDDVTLLPTKVSMGSTAFVIETSNIYMLNSNKEWVKV